MPESPRHALRRGPPPFHKGGKGANLLNRANHFDMLHQTNLAPLVKGGRAAAKRWRGDSSQRTPKKVSTGEKRRRRELPKKSALEKRGVAGNSRKSQHWRKEALQSPLRKSPSAPQWSPESSPPASPGAPAAPSRSPPPSAGSESRRIPRPKIPTSSATPPAGRPANSESPS